MEEIFLRNIKRGEKVMLIDLIIRLRYEMLKEGNHINKSNKKKINEFYYLLDELEKNVKSLLKNN